MRLEIKVVLRLLMVKDRAINHIRPISTHFKAFEYGILFRGDFSTKASTGITGFLKM
jgi:hypothetical protein